MLFGERRDGVGARAGLHRAIALPPERSGFRRFGLALDAALFLDRPPRTLFVTEWVAHRAAPRWVSRASKSGSGAKVPDPAAAATKDRVQGRGV
jgi:hypothetical protein